MDIAQVRELALALPHATEASHYDKSSFRVGGKIFATVPADELHLHLHVHPDDARALLSENPLVFEPIMWGRDPAPDWIRVRLRDVDPAEMHELLEDAWRLVAPPGLRAELDQAAPGCG